MSPVPDRGSRMERLSSLDAVFLAVEDPGNHMSIGTVGVFAGPSPSLDEVRQFVARRIAAVPRCRQRVREPRGLLGRPVWIDAAGFAIEDHVLGLALPDQGAGRLEGLVAGLLASPLDRSRPLWELWVVDGLPEDRWALVAKVHHCMVDGIAGSDLLTAVLADPPDGSTVTADRWVPAREPSPTAYARFCVRSGLGTLWGHLRGAAQVLSHPARSWRRSRDVLRAARRLWYRQRHVPTSLTGPIGSDRRWAHVAVAIDDVRTIRDALGGTVNDVVVTAVSCAFRDLLLARGEPVADRTITAMIPVSLRTTGERSGTGNRVANVHALLPVGVGDPCSALRSVHDQLEELKGSHEVEATGLLLRIGDYVPRVVADRVVRSVLRRQRNVETVVTNVPGPRSPLQLAGCVMVEGYPVAPIAGCVRIGVAVWSYCDRLAIGITADRATVPDIERLGSGITRGFADLLEAARSGAR